MRIEICGNIGSGKSTLADLLSNLATSVFEDFEQNPFLADFYTDPLKYGLETEIAALLLHYHQIKKSIGSEKLVCDFSFILDLAFAHANLPKNDYEIYQKLQMRILNEIHIPSVIISVECEPDILLPRIKARGRKEEQAITKQYLEDIQTAINNEMTQFRINHTETHIITVNTGEIDYVNDAQAQLEIVSQLKKIL